jgi:hypothetical protein
MSIYSNTTEMIDGDKPLMMVVAYPLYDAAHVFSKEAFGSLDDSTTQEQVRPRIGLVRLNTDGSDPLNTYIQHVTEQSETLAHRHFHVKELTLSYRDNDDHDDTTLPVFNVGDYDVSIAFGLNDLLTRINSVSFNKPEDFEKRVGTFLDSNLYLGPMFYVVAQRVPNFSGRKQSSFGVVYPSPISYQYFPICHQGSYGDVVEYDVQCTFLIPRVDESMKIASRILPFRFNCIPNVDFPEFGYIQVKNVPESHHFYETRAPNTIEFVNDQNNFCRNEIEGCMIPIYNQNGNSEYAFGAHGYKDSILCTSLIEARGLNQNIHTRVDIAMKE